MNDHTDGSASRRNFVKGAASLAGIAIVALLTPAQNASAQSKMTKAVAQYQDKAKDGKDCDDCVQFIHGKTPKAKGTCKVVEGDISPTGWCIAFAPKPKKG